MKLLCKGLIILLSIAAGFGADKDKPVFKPGPADSYPHRQRISKLTIAADAFTEPGEMRAAFGKLNPSKYGLLPILVVMRNDSGQALRLDTMRVEYIRDDGRSLEPIPPEDIPYLTPVKQPNMGGAKWPTPPIPGLSGKKKNPLAAFEVQGRAFAAKMLPPRDSAEGFFYFYTAPLRGSTLYITGITEAATGQELFYFEIPLD